MLYTVRVVARDQQREWLVELDEAEIVDLDARFAAWHEVGSISRYRITPIEALDAAETRKKIVSFAKRNASHR